MKDDIYTKLNRRAKLVRLTRRAWTMWCEAEQAHEEQFCALTVSGPCVKEAEALCQHRFARYRRLEALLSETTGLTKTSVFNNISYHWPCVPALMTNL